MFVLNPRFYNFYFVLIHQHKLLACSIQALYVLHDYRDRNTAIALLSLGQDREALRILEALPATATSEYLRAIACSRLGRKAEGRRHFLEACRRDERMEYRAALDPEIDELLKN